MEIGNQLPLNEETKKKLADLVYLYIISSHFEGKINIKAYRDIYSDINNYLEYMAICAYFAEGLEPEKNVGTDYIGGKGVVINLLKEHFILDDSAKDYLKAHGYAKYFEDEVIKGDVLEKIDFLFSGEKITQI